MSSFHLGYGTNGFANHRLDDALAIIADLGYTAVALTLDHQHLDPYADDLTAQVAAVGRRLAELELRVVIETGARYLLDPRHKHQPTLLSDDPGPRIDFLQRALRIAIDLGADCVSFWSGVTPAGLAADEAWRRLRDGVAAVLPLAAELGMPLGLEPEPGMLVERLADALRLRSELADPPLLGITLDVGHCVAVEPTGVADCVRQAAGLLVNVQLDDMVTGVHEHLEFGDGELDLPACLAALTEIGYTGVAAVELPRHSHAAPEVARRSITALQAALPWIARAEAAIRRQPRVIGELFPAAGREVGRRPLEPAADPAGLITGTEDDRARARLITVLVETMLADGAPELAAAELAELYRYGDDAERRGVLRGLSALTENDPPEAVIEAGRALVQDALRANDTRLIAAAMGPFAGASLDQHTWRHGVLKCLFTGVPLAAVAALAERCDAELLRMVTGLAEERAAAGRPVPDDAIALLQKETV